MLLRPILFNHDCCFSLQRLEQLLILWNKRTIEASSSEANHFRDKEAVMPCHQVTVSIDTQCLTTAPHYKTLHQDLESCVHDSVRSKISI